MRGTYISSLNQKEVYGHILVLIIAIGLLIFLAFNIQGKQRKIKDLQGEVVLWKDKYGNAHASTNTVELTDAEMKRITDSIADVLRVPPRTITRYIRTGIGIDTNLVINRNRIRDTAWLPGGGYRIDTLYELKYDHFDPKTGTNWLSVYGKVPQDPQRLNVKVNADLVFTERRQGTGFLGLGKKEVITDVGTNNPYINFTGVTSFTRTEKPKFRLRPGVGIGANYNPWTKKIDYGVQAGVYFSYGR